VQKPAQPSQPTAAGPAAR